MGNNLESTTQEQKAKEYGDLVQNILSGQYTINDQIAILKHQLEALAGDNAMPEFKQFIADGEKAKASAKAYVDKNINKGGLL